MRIFWMDGRTEFRIAASGAVTISGFPDAPWRLGANAATG
jgi:hypothetical protein